MMTNVLHKTRTQLGPILRPDRVQGWATHFSKQQASKQQAFQKSLRLHRSSKPTSKWLKTTWELMRITTNKFCVVSSRLASFMADFVSKNGRFGALFRTIVLKV